MGKYYYKILGDEKSYTRKSDCEKRIKELHRFGEIDKEKMVSLLSELRILKR